MPEMRKALLIQGFFFSGSTKNLYITVGRKNIIFLLNDFIVQIKIYKFAIIICK